MVTDELGTCAGYFLRYAAYFYRFSILYATYHPLLCLAEASRLGHLFAELDVLRFIERAFLSKSTIRNVQSLWFRIHCRSVVLSRLMKERFRWRFV